MGGGERRSQGRPCLPDSRGVLMDIDLNVDGPHSPERTKEVADLLAECVRYLNYATMSGNGLTDPADVYYILGALYTGTERLPQLFGNLARLLAAQAATGR